MCVSFTNTGNNYSLKIKKHDQLYMNCEWNKYMLNIKKKKMFERFIIPAGIESFLYLTLLQAEVNLCNP